jgi:outer membrane protein assembly factor BamA
VDLALHDPRDVRSLMFLAAIVVAGTWLAARHLPQGEAHAESVEKQVRTQEVQSISIDTPKSPRDERRLPISELRMLLTTRPGDLLDQQKLERDRKAIEATLVARGFLAARVAPASVTFTNNGGAYVVFDVERGPMYRLRSVTVTGPGEADLDVVTLSAGDDAIHSRIERARQTLADAIAHRSTKSRVEVRLHEDPATASLDVELATTEVTVMRQSLLSR